MICAVDIGNSSTAAGLMAGTEVHAHTSLPTNAAVAPEAIWTKLAKGLGDKSDVEGAIVCSVVPKATPNVMAAIRTGAGVEPVEFTADTPIGITNRYEPPSDVGADRLANAYAAWKLYGLPAIIVDIGTGLTVDCVNEQAEYLGGVIAPGIGISLDALHNRTAMLPKVELEPPPRVLGTSTVTSIQSGVTHGHALMIAGLVDKLRDELKFGPGTHVIITGGYTAILGPQIEAISTLIEPELTLKGLALIHRAITPTR
jgi:type III pantothenate kinase